MLAGDAPRLHGNILRVNASGCQVSRRARHAEGWRKADGGSGVLSLKRYVLPVCVNVSMFVVVRTRFFWDRLGGGVLRR